MIIIIGIFLFILAMMLTGNVIIVGEKIGVMTHLWWMEYVFYGIILVLMAYFIIVPIIRIHRAAPFPSMNVDGEFTPAQLSDFGAQLAQNCSYLPDQTVTVEGDKTVSLRKHHQQDLKAQLLEASADTEQLRQIIQAELDIRFKGDKNLQVLGIDRRIREWAKSVFMITAISQNSRFDTFSAMFLNLRMIADIINASGFRPTNRQLFRMYGSILTTALITYAVSEALTTTGSVAPFDFGDLDSPADAATDAADDVNLDDVDIDNVPEGFSFYSVLRRIKIPSIVVSAAIDGTVNALLTLRIGYITRAYLVQGASALDGIKNKRAIKRQAMLDSMKNIPYVIAAGSTVVGKRTSQFLLHLVRSESATPSFLKKIREKLHKNR
ncbi:MAG: DUF697 domain-containing protein [Paludibacteraceae bacterium]|nr:DUF697 domain-containing protein [Paludibacteraceae bacterium]